MDFASARSPSVNNLTVDEGPMDTENSVAQVRGGARRFTK